MNDMQLPESGKESIELIVDTSQPSLFSDNVFIESTNEHVVLNFMQRLPKDGSPNAKARCAARIVLTVPHFIRLTDVCNGLVANLPKSDNEEKGIPK